MESNLGNQSNQWEELWTSVSILKKRKNALRIEAFKTRRTVGNFLDVFLEKHGIREISDSEYERFMKKREMVTPEVKI